MADALPTGIPALWDQVPHKDGYDVVALLESAGEKVGVVADSADEPRTRSDDTHLEPGPRFIRADRCHGGHLGPVDDVLRCALSTRHVGIPSPLAPGGWPGRRSTQDTSRRSMTSFSIIDIGKPCPPQTRFVGNQDTTPLPRSSKPGQLGPDRCQHGRGRYWLPLPGFFSRTGYGTYRLNTPPPGTSSTTAPDLNYVVLPRRIRARNVRTPGGRSCAESSAAWH